MNSGAILTKGKLLIDWDGRWNARAELPDVSGQAAEGAEGINSKYEYRNSKQIPISKFEIQN